MPYVSRSRDSEEGDDHLDPDDATWITDAEVTCPYCGEDVTIALDPSGGPSQAYVEDCPVCCQPWQVQVSYDQRGAAEVSLEVA